MPPHRESTVEHDGCYGFLAKRRALPEPCAGIRRGALLSLLGMLTKAAALVHVDFAPRHRQPSWARVALATLVSLAGSLLADALAVVVFQAVLPSTRGYAHFQVADYAKLTILGVLIACVAWPVTTRISSAPRWLFFRMAILVTLVLFAPDFYILYLGQPGNAVAGLLVMHVAIALVTYNALVRLAPVRSLPAGGPAAPGDPRPVTAAAAQGRGTHRAR
jgi:hypothetical protein